MWTPHAWLHVAPHTVICPCSTATTPAEKGERAAMLIPVMPAKKKDLTVTLAAFRVTPATTVIVGRGAAADVQIVDKRISSKHCTIEVRGEGAPDDEQGVWVTDTSGNGTFVNGVRMEKGVPTKVAASSVLALMNPSKGDIISFVVHGGGPPDVDPNSGDVVEAAAKRRKVDPEDAGAAAASGAGPAATGDAASADAAEAEALECCVCREILHGVVTVLPCLHNFCGGCLSEWQEKGSRECPSCRGPCTDVRRNHQFQSVIQEFLDRNPSLKRTAEELAALDKKDKFTDENLRVASTRRGGDADGYDDYTGSEEDSEEEEDDVCHECPDAGNQPAPPDGHRCGGVHVACSACASLMPNRRGDATLDRPQRCVCCNRNYCNLYYEYKGGCRGGFGGGDRAKLRKLGDDVKTELPRQALRGNTFELGLIPAMVGADGVGSIWTAADKAALVQAVFPAVAAADVGTGDDCVTCGSCSDQLWRRAVDDWRFAADASLVPAHAQSRPNCWYGQECRTQVHNAGHAARFNHICPRTAPP
eukprot:m.214903 g.214903  ORF g.214903 m.214903 type:complete len:533 (-) comp15537_c0_seq8:17-1615(-)